MTTLKIKSIYLRTDKKVHATKYVQIEEVQGSNPGYNIMRFPILGYDPQGNPRYGDKLAPINFYPIHMIEQVVYHV